MLELSLLELKKEILVPIAGNRPIIGFITAAPIEGNFISDFDSNQKLFRLL